MNELEDFLRSGLLTFCFVKLAFFRHTAFALNRFSAAKAFLRVALPDEKIAAFVSKTVMRPLLVTWLIWEGL